MDKFKFQEENGNLTIELYSYPNQPAHGKKANDNISLPITNFEEELKKTAQYFLEFIKSTKKFSPFYHWEGYID